MRSSMASHSARNIKGLKNTIWADYSCWPDCDEGALSEDALSKFLARKKSIKAYLDGVPVSIIKSEFGLSDTWIYRLITERCLCIHSDGQIYGWRALTPDLRIAPYKRTSPIVVNQWGGGAVGALQTVLDIYPDIKIKLDKRILSTPKTQKKLTILSRTTRSTWLWLLERLREKGLEIRGEWPFNTQTLGYHSINRYIKKKLEENPAKAILIEGGNELKRKMQAGDGVDRPIAKPFQRVEMDAHKIDARFTVAIPLTDGGYENKIIHRIWVIVIIEVITRLVLGYHMSLRKEISKEDVLRVIKKSLSPWKKISIHHSKKDFYSKDAGFASILGDEYIGICWDETSIDGALAEKAKAVEDALKNTVNSKLLTPNNSFSIRRSKDDRPFIESFFNKIGKYGFQKISNTTGNEPGATKGRDPVGVAITSQFQYEYAEELLDIIIANYNGTIHSRLSGRSPLQYLRYLVQSKSFIPRIVDPHLLETFFSYRKECIVKGGIAVGKRPYVNFENAIYTSPILGQRLDLTGKRIWIVADADSDSRIVRAVTLGGEHIDNLRVSPPWSRIPHTFETRRLICALIRNGKFRLNSQEDAVEAYINQVEASGGKLPPHPAYLSVRNFMAKYSAIVPEQYDEEKWSENNKTSFSEITQTVRAEFRGADRTSIDRQGQQTGEFRNPIKEKPTNKSIQKNIPTTLPPRRKTENK
jgi:transposase InsO family protein